MALAWPFKDPDEILDYRINWVARLGVDTIVTSTFSVAVGAGLVVDSNSFTDTITTVWLSGGTLGVTYQVLNRITTLGGRTMDQTVKLKIKAK